jgi:hypothetical protein
MRLVLSCADVFGSVDNTVHHSSLNMRRVVRIKEKIPSNFNKVDLFHTVKSTVDYFLH